MDKEYEKSIDEVYARLKGLVKHKLATDSNARQFLEDGTVTMDGNVWYQYYLFNPKESVEPEDVANHIIMQSTGVDQIRTNKERSGIRIRVKFFNDRKPRGFDSAMKRMENDNRYGRLLTYKDCQVTLADLD